VTVRVQVLEAISTDIHTCRCTTTPVCRRKRRTKAEIAADAARGPAPGLSLTGRPFRDTAGSPRDADDRGLVWPEGLSTEAPDQGRNRGRRGRRSRSCEHDGLVSTDEYARVNVSGYSLEDLHPDCHSLDALFVTPRAALGMRTKSRPTRPPKPKLRARRARLDRRVRRGVAHPRREPVVVALVETRTPAGAHRGSLPSSLERESAMKRKRRTKAEIAADAAAEAEAASTTGSSRQTSTPRSICTCECQWI
jgi:hypothetical protein